MFKSLPNSKYPTGILYFLTEHTLIIYVQYIKGSKRKHIISFREIFRERFSIFRFSQHFKRLNFEYPSSEAVSIKTVFDDCIFLEIRLAHGNQLLPNITEINE